MPSEAKTDFRPKLRDVWLWVMVPLKTVFPPKNLAAAKDTSPNHDIGVPHLQFTQFIRLAIH